MLIQKALLSILLISSLFQSSGENQDYDPPSAYEILERFGFPKGILPEGVQSYLLQPDGAFQVFFAYDCEFKVQGSYLLRYKKIISGTVDSGTLRDLKGVSVKVLFVWIGITDVVVTGDELKFYVGPFSASFPAANFNECPKCRCGFDCASSLVSDS